MRSRSDMAPSCLEQKFATWCTHGCAVTPMPANAIVVHYDGWSGNVITLELDGSERWRGRPALTRQDALSALPAITVSVIGTSECSVRNGHFETDGVR